MRIESDIKLGFKDVMIRPKRSTLKSRAEVSLVRKLHFDMEIRNGKAFPLLPQIWIRLVHLKWHQYWHNNN